MTHSTLRHARPRAAAAVAVACLLLAPLASAIDITVDVLDDPVPNGCTPGSCSLREAVTLANSLAGPDRILLPATPVVPLQLTIPGADETANATGDLNVLEELEIAGTGAATTRLVQTTADRVLRTSMPTGQRLTLRGLTIEGGSAGIGGALRATSRLTIEDAAFVGNHANSSGGAISFGGTNLEYPEPHLVLRRVVFRGNRASPVSGVGEGGAVDANSLVFGDTPFLLMEDCLFEDNAAATSGGALRLNGSPNLTGGVAVIRRTTFTGNRSDGQGGAIHLPFSAFQLRVSDSVFEGNEGAADASAGGIDATSARSISVVRSTFSGNSGTHGGAIHSRAPPAGHRQPLLRQPGRRGRWRAGGA